MKPILAAVVMSVALILAGCSSGDEDEAPEQEPVAEVAASEPEAAPAEAPAEVAPAVEAPAAGEAAAVAGENPLENTVYLETACGRITIELRPDLAPLHVEQIKTLARQEFYDGQIFHRVIDGFMAQTGDPTGTGVGASPLPNIRAEFGEEPFVRGAVGMARGQSVNSANSQFFIMFERWASLDGQYTIWGYVTDGMDCVDQIARGEPPADPTVMISLRVAADVE